MIMFDQEQKVVAFTAELDKRRAQEQAAFERVSRVDGRLKLLAATIEVFREGGSSNEEIVRTLRFAIDVLEGRKR